MKSVVAAWVSYRLTWRDHRGRVELILPVSMQTKDVVYILKNALSTCIDKK